MNRIRLIALLLSVWLLAPALTAAQSATPDIGPDVPSVDLCSIDPRTPDAIETLVSSMSGQATPVLSIATPNAQAATPTPFAAPVGTPVSADIGDEVAQVVTMFYACQNANDPMRTYALLTDGYLVRTIEAGMIDPASFASAGTPAAPRLESEQLAIAINGMIEIMPDIYGVDVVGIDGATGDEFTDYLIVVRQDDALRIDEVIPLS